MWIALIVVVVLLIVWIIGVYNNLVSLKMRVKNAWAQIDTQLKRRFDLIPNLVETVKGYAAHEQGTLEKVIAARNTYASATSVEDKAKANNELTSTLKSIFALGEAYPELKANENFLALQTELAGTEDKVAYSRQFYNDTVQMYNTAIMKFPNNILAGMFGYKEEPFFTIDDAEKEPVKVQF
ncbi:MAG: LemA family protein [Clostridia bacterium]|jgi:LemA protein|nr:LemA family protein [Clostridia bacterium]